MSPKWKLSSVISSGTRHTDRNMPVTNMEKLGQKASLLLTFLHSPSLWSLVHNHCQPEQSPPWAVLAPNSPVPLAAHGVCILTADWRKEKLKAAEVSVSKMCWFGPAPEVMIADLFYDGRWLYQQKIVPWFWQTLFLFQGRLTPAGFKEYWDDKLYCDSFPSSHQWALPRVSGFRQSWGQFLPKQRDSGLVPGIQGFASHCG